MLQENLGVRAEVCLDFIAERILDPKTVIVFEPCKGKTHRRAKGLTRISSAAASETAAGYIWKYVNHESGRKQAG